MSQRDRKLLDEAGLNITDAASLFDRSRQALYTGLSNERDYFSSRDVKAILDDAENRDFPRLSELMQFVEGAYPDYPELALPRVSVEKLGLVLSQSRKILLITNGNADHFDPDGMFAKVLNDAMQHSPDAVRLILPAPWVIGFIEHQNVVEPTRAKVHLPPTSQISYREEAAFLPSFVVTEDGAQRYRAFVFVRFAIEEMVPSEARKLWNHFAPPSPWQISQIMSDVAG